MIHQNLKLEIIHLFEMRRNDLVPTIQQLDACIFLVNESTMTPSINSHIIFGVVLTVTENLYKVSAINLDTF